MKLKPAFPGVVLGLLLLGLGGSCKNPYSEIENQAADYHVVPLPVELTQAKGRFVLNDEVVIISDSATLPEAEYLKEMLGSREGSVAPEIIASGSSDGAVILQIDSAANLPEEGYELKATADEIVIKAGSGRGIFYGIQTLLQLVDDPAADGSLPHASIPAVELKDAPRFAYRGMHLDVARHFQPVSFVKKYIDLLAMHKFNTFHWHLTEDQGWRIEIKKYPRLTEVGAWRNGTVVGKAPWTENDNERYGGFYTQEEIKEVVAYAKERHITIIPEIELPGHSSAAIAAYPFLSCFPEKPTNPKRGVLSEKSVSLQEAGQPKVVFEEWGVTDDVYCAGKEETFEFLEDVLDEVVQLFPSEYIHIGGDECPKGHWEECANCQKRIEEEGLADEHELQSYFITRMEKYLNDKGRQIIGWDEILEGGLAPNATVMYWRAWTGTEGINEAATKGHDLIMTPTSHLYFDFYQADPETEPMAICCMSTVENVYGYEPIPEELSEEAGDLVLGAQANVWTEYMKDSDYVEYMVLPRMTALSEVLWTPAEGKDYQDFLSRLTTLRETYDREGYNYAKHVFEAELAKNE